MEEIKNDAFKYGSICEQQKPKLPDQLRNAIRLRHYSIRTEETYARR